MVTPAESSLPTSGGPDSILGQSPKGQVHRATLVVGVPSEPDHYADYESTRTISISQGININSVESNGVIVAGTRASPVHLSTPNEAHFPALPGPINVTQSMPCQETPSNFEKSELGAKLQQNEENEDDVDLDQVTPADFEQYCSQRSDQSYHQAAIQGNDPRELAIPQNSSTGPRSDVYDLGHHQYQIQRIRDGVATHATPQFDEEEVGDLSLENQLVEALEPQGHDGPQFLPLGQLERLVCKKNVEKELLCTFPDFPRETLHHWTSQICNFPANTVGGSNTNSYRKIFAILVLVDRLQDIPRFLDEANGICDQDLPLKKVFQRGKRNLFDLRLNTGSRRNLICFRGWGQPKIRDFHAQQCAMTATFFSKGDEQTPIHTYFLDKYDRLPFTFDARYHGSTNCVRQGGYATVFKVLIHPDHHGFDDSDNRGFAIKEVEQKTDKHWIAFKQEIDIYATFRRAPHDHIPNLLGTFEQDNKKYMILPWADKDLLDFWKTVPCGKRLDYDRVKWMVQQCVGIASALHRIHFYHGSKRQISDSTVSSLDESGNMKQRVVVTRAPGGPQLYGRHGDIKARNVLVYQDPRGGQLGTLKLSDFGVAEITSKDSKSNKHKASQVPNTNTYSPPETKLGMCVTQAFDIWTLGCLYLEFIAWILGGHALIESFATARQESVDMEDIDSQMEGQFLDTFFCTYTSSGKKVADVKRAVKQFVWSQHDSQSCSGFLHAFLELIMKQMLHPQPEKRAKCGEIVARLERMRIKCESDRDYAVKPVSPPPECQMMQPTPITPPKTSKGKYQLLFIKKPQASGKNEM